MANIAIILEKKIISAEKEYFNKILNYSKLAENNKIIEISESELSDTLLDSKISEKLKNIDIIITTGSALKEFSGIPFNKLKHGKPLYSDKYNCKIIPTISIKNAYFKNKVNNSKIILNDFNIVLRELKLKNTNKYNYIIINDNEREKFDKLIEKLKTLSLYAIDIEYDSTERKNKLLGIGFSWNDKQGVYVVLQDQFKEINKQEWNYRINRLRDVLESDNSQKIAHELKTEYVELLKRANIKCKNLWWDTLTMAHIEDVSRQSFALESLVDEFASDLSGYKNESEAFIKDGDSFAKIPTVILGRRCCMDCDTTQRIFKQLKPRLEQMNLLSLYKKIVLPHTYVCASGTARGILIDSDELTRIKKIVKEKIDNLLIKIQKLTDEKFNPRSPQDIKKFVGRYIANSDFKYLKKTSAHRKNNSEITIDTVSLDENALKYLSKKGYELPVLLVKYRQLYKLYSTYIEGIEKSSIDSIIYPNFKMHGTASGRISCVSPNTQNMPTNGKLIKDYELPEDISIKKLFIPRSGYKFIVSDASQIELRLLAHLSNDYIMKNIFINNGDLHKETMLGIFPESKELLEKLQNEPNNEYLKNSIAHLRREAKTVNFGIAYGIEAKKLSKDLGISIEHAQHLIDKFYEVYPGVLEWKYKTIAICRQYGYVQNIFGRRRKICNINSDDKFLRGEAERQCINTPVQGSAADCVSIANNRIFSEINKRNLDAHFLLEVHDELLYECNENCLDEVKAITKEQWEIPMPSLTVPIKASIEVGTLWEH